MIFVKLYNENPLISENEFINPLMLQFELQSEVDAAVELAQQQNLYITIDYTQGGESR